MKDVLAYFVSISSPYDDVSTAHFFTLSLNIFETLEVNIKSTKNDRGGDVEDIREGGTGEAYSEEALFRERRSPLQMEKGSWIT